ncbi:MAG: serine hydrolase, partial [Saprospiraceae bacterium]|nr:serine hydrolase [Saprospiraceae bacterium]
LEIDKPVREYLPELKFKNEYTNDHVTLLDMMCHRTGLPRHDFSWYGSTASRSELLKRIEFLEPAYELREKYQYNNFMFMAQGVVIEKLTGKSWEDNLKTRILEPLAMLNTNVSVIDMEKEEDRSLAYNTIKEEIIKLPYRNIDAIGPAGSINSCARDMANWLITWINDGKFKDQQIIPAGFRLQAMTAQISPGGGLPGEENPDLHMSGYGLAWGMNSYRGHYRVEHGGGIDGFSSSTCFFPSDSIGIFVVSNQGTPTSSIRNFIADRMLGLPYRNWGKTQLENRMKADSMATTGQNMDSLRRKVGTTPSHDLESYIGNFENKGYGIAKIFTENDTLWADYNEAGERTKTYLEHYHYDVFKLRSTDEKTANNGASKLNFKTDIRGEIVSFEVQLEPAVDDIVFEKMDPVLELTTADLNKYVGNYDLNGLNVKVYIRGSNTLMVLVPGQPDYELVPVEEHLFNLKIADGYSVKFDLSDEGKVTQLSFLQPNGVFTASRK